MAFMLGEDIDCEIRTAFQSDTPQTFNQDDEIRNKFKEHKKLLIKHLNRKWESGMCHLWRPTSHTE